jgi:hypothetical protein
MALVTCRTWPLIQTLNREMRRRAAIEPAIGHLKEDHQAHCNPHEPRGRLIIKGARTVYEHHCEAFAED